MYAIRKVLGFKSEVLAEEGVMIFLWRSQRRLRGMTPEQNLENWVGEVADVDRRTFRQRGKNAQGLVARKESVPGKVQNFSSLGCN